MRRLAYGALGDLSLILVALGLLSLLSVPTRAPTADQRTEKLSIRTWDALWTSVLTRYVDDAGQIDFSALLHGHDDLDRVVAFIAAVDLISQPQRFSDRASFRHVRRCRRRNAV